MRADRLLTAAYSLVHSASTIIMVWWQGSHGLMLRLALISQGVLEFRRAARELGVDQPCCVQNAYSLLQRVSSTPPPSA